MQHDRQRPSAEVAPKPPSPLPHHPHVHLPLPLCVPGQHLLQLQVSSLVFSGHPLCGQSGMAVATRRSRFKGLPSAPPPLCLPLGLQHSACLLTQLIFEKTQKKERILYENRASFFACCLTGLRVGVTVRFRVYMCVCKAIYPAQNCHINSTASETCRAYFILYFMIFSLTG